MLEPPAAVADCVCYCCIQESGETRSKANHDGLSLMVSDRSSNKFVNSLQNLLCY